MNESTYIKGTYIENTSKSRNKNKNKNSKSKHDLLDYPDLNIEISNELLEASGLKLSVANNLLKLTSDDIAEFFCDIEWK